MKPYAPLALLLLSGCQYTSFLKTNSDYYADHYGSSPAVICSAMGGMPNNSAYDWCVADEEAAQARDRERQGGPPAEQ